MKSLRHSELITAGQLRPLRANKQLRTIGAAFHKKFQIIPTKAKQKQRIIQ
jgi:hypothetical protein